MPCWAMLFITFHDDADIARLFLSQRHASSARRCFFSCQQREEESQYRYHGAITARAVASSWPLSDDIVD